MMVIKSLSKTDLQGPKGSGHRPGLPISKAEGATLFRGLPLGGQSQGSRLFGGDDLV